MYTLIIKIYSEISTLNPGDPNNIIRNQKGRDTYLRTVTAQTGFRTNAVKPQPPCYAFRFHGVQT